MTIRGFSYKIKYAIFRLRGMIYHMPRENDYLIIKVLEKEVSYHENDISAQEAFPFQGSRLQSQNEYSRRKKSFSSETCKRKKEIIRIGHSNVTFLYYEIFGVIKEKSPVPVRL